MTDFVEQTNFVEQNNGAKLYEDIATYPVDSLFNTQLIAQLLAHNFADMAVVETLAPLVKPTISRPSARQRPLFKSVIINVSEDKSSLQTEQHLLNAQRLRTLTFTQAFSVSFAGFHPSSEQPLDRDDFDNYCTHVVVYDETKQDSFGQPLAVATTRLLDKNGAIKAGHFYSEHEFRLGRLLDDYPYNVLEIGRTCVHPDYRGITTINHLWESIAAVAKAYNVNAFMGCASVPMEEGNVQNWLDHQLDSTKLDVKVTRKLPEDKLSAIDLAQVADVDLANPQNFALPAPLKMYVKMGCSLGAAACYDPEFDCADVFVWLPFEQVKPRYQHYLH